jgi:hypothetical protein
MTRSNALEPREQVAKSTRICASCGSLFAAIDPSHVLCPSCYAGSLHELAGPSTGAGIRAWRSPKLEAQRTIPNTQPWKRKRPRAYV